jgi:hypothetical protein
VDGPASARAAARPARSRRLRSFRPSSANRRISRRGQREILSLSIQRRPCRPQEDSRKPIQILAEIPEIFGPGFTAQMT